MLKRWGWRPRRSICCSVRHSCSSPSTKYKTRTHLLFCILLLCRGWMWRYGICGALGKHAHCWIHGFLMLASSMQWCKHCSLFSARPLTRALWQVSFADKGVLSEPSLPPSLPPCLPLSLYSLFIFGLSALSKGRTLLHFEHAVDTLRLDGLQVV